MIFRSKKPPIQDVEKERTFLILRFGSMKEACYRWSIAPMAERESFSPAQKQAILQYFEEQSHITESTGPK